MIYITGDTHSDFWRFNTKVFTEQKGMTKEDTVIICGDFGGVWYPERMMQAFSRERANLDVLDNRKFTTVFVDGNHENFTRLTEYPVREWNGGLVHEIRPSVLHLMRGEVYTIEGKKFFAFGGASSHDIRDGILEKDDERIIKWMHNPNKEFRVRGLSWWDEELPNKEELDNGIAKLEEHNWKVDFVITHSPPASIVALLGQGLYKQDILTRYLEEVRIKLDYKKWFFGHLHIDEAINDKEIGLYEQIIRVV